MSDLSLAPASGWRHGLARFIESAPVQRLLVAAILLNAVTLGLETSPSVVAAVGPLLAVVDGVVLAVFLAELAAKLVAWRLAFFRSGWNVFDFLVVGVALAPDSGPLSVLRALRVLRLLRLLSVVPAMRLVVTALISAIPGMGAVVSVSLLLFYIAAVLATKLYGIDFPAFFGTIGDSMFTLFQVMTLEAWADGIARPVMEQHPWAWLFFVPFVVVTSFAVLNLFIGIIVASMEKTTDDQDAARDADLMTEVKALRQEVRALGDALKAAQEGGSRSA